MNSTESRPVFRGWRVLSGLFLVYAASNGILMHTLPLLYPELINEFGWSEVQVTLPATMFFVVGALTSPPAGVLLDQFSPRKIIFFGATGIVAGLALYAGFNQLWQLVAIYIFFGISLSACGLVSNMLVLSRWFSRLRGRATGVLLMASSLGGVVFPLLMGHGIENWGWRQTLLIFALMAALMMILPLILLIRDNPQHYGLFPDGRKQPPERPEPDLTDHGNGRRNVSLADALKEKNFYLLAVATAAVWFSIISLVQHQSIFLGRDAGVSRALLPVIFSAFFASSVMGKLVFGFLSDYFRKDWVLIGSIIVLMTGLLILRNIDGTQNAPLFVYAVIAGIGFSGAFTSIQLLIAHFYAGTSYGKILAILVLIDTLAGALGTRVVGMIRVSQESYLPAFDLQLTVCAVAVMALFFLHNSCDNKLSV